MMKEDHGCKKIEEGKLMKRIALNLPLKSILQGCISQCSHTCETYSIQKQTRPLYKEIEKVVVHIR